MYLQRTYYDDAGNRVRTELIVEQYERTYGSIVRSMEAEKLATENKERRLELRRKRQHFLEVMAALLTAVGIFGACEWVSQTQHLTSGATILMASIALLCELGVVAWVSSEW